MLRLMPNRKFPDLKTYRPIALSDPSNVITEQYRKIRTNIELINLDQPLKTISVTSSLGSEGKSTTAINLATVYAQSEVKTLLIDFDLRKPKIHRGFGLLNDLGVTDVVALGKPLEKAIHKVDEHLHVMTAGSKVPFPAELLASKKFSAFMEELFSQYDKVIVDTPPVSAVADAIIVAKKVDGVLFVVASRATNVDTAQAVIKSLSDSKINILGAVMTRLQRKDYRDLNYYYYNYKYSDDQE